MNFSETFFRNLCLFYLKLQGQLLLPASTIQVLVEEMQNVHELGLDYTLSKLHSLLKNQLNQTDDVMGRVFDCIKDSDLFSSAYKGPLRTTYARTQTFKRMFKYIEPKIVRLGYDENMRQKNACYTPLKQSLLCSVICLACFKGVMLALHNLSKKIYFFFLPKNKNKTHFPLQVK